MNEIEKEIKKVAVGFAMLQNGQLSIMSDEDFNQFLKWLEA